jgi:hypothetical protein
VQDPFQAEVKARIKAAKQDAAKAKDFNSHYEMGEMAAWRGESVDAMPKFKKQERVAAWLKGHAAGLLAYEAHKLSQRPVDRDKLKSNLARIKSLVEAMPDHEAVPLAKRWG